MRKYLFENRKLLLACTLTFKMLHNIVAIGVAVILSALIDTINQNDVQSIKNMAIISICYAFIVGIITFIAMKLDASYKKKVMISIKKDLMNGILRKDIVDFQKENSAKYISLFNNNLSVIEENYVKNFISIFDSITMILLAIGLLIYFNLVIAIVAILFSIIPVIIPMFFGKKLGKSQQDIASSSSLYNSKIKDIFNGFDVIKSYNISSHIYEEHNDYCIKMEQNKYKNNSLMAYLYGITNFASISVQFIIILFAGYLTIKGYITLGNIIAITQLSGQAISPAFELSNKFGLLKSVKPINEEILNFIDIKDNTKQKIYEKAISLNKHIKLRDITFAYDDKIVLSNLNATFDKNKKYAIVGRSGCGKSTLLKLLLHYYDGYSGNILLDNLDYKTLTAENVNKLYSFLQQSVFLFDDTIKNNITLFENITEEKLQNVIKQAGLFDLIHSLPNGIDTKVGECGNLLSGGERQRIAIARALLKGSEVMILDEATSALDNTTAAYIENTILNMDNITSIIVTHRLNKAILQKYDQIVVMDSGNIIAKGTFNELLETNSLFKKLYYANEI